MQVREQDVQYVIGAEGKPTAVLVDIAAWEQILNALEDAEDVSFARDALAALDAVGGDLQKAGFISWEKARAELENMDGAEK
jgi:hypothetical protein